MNIKLKNKMSMERTLLIHPKSHLIFLLILLIPLFCESKPQSKVVSNILIKQDTAQYISKDSITLKTKELIENKETKIYLTSNSKTNIFKDILPLLALILGIFINRGIDLISERKKTKKIGERWKAELSSLELPMQKQIELLNEFLLEHEKEEFTIPQLTISSALNGDAFNSLDKTDLIKYLEKFRKKKYTEAVITSNKINSFVGILRNNYTVLKQKFHSFLTDSSTHMTNLSINLQQLMKSFAEYGVQLEIELGKDPIDDPRYRLIYDLFSIHIIPYMETGDYEIYALEKNFFSPLMAILGVLRLDQRINNMSEYTRNCLNFIKAIKMEKRYLSKNISTLIKRYEEEAQDLKSLLTEL